MARMVGTRKRQWPTGADWSIQFLWEFDWMSKNGYLKKTSWNPWKNEIQRAYLWIIFNHMQSSSQNLMAFPKKNDVPNHSIFPSFTRIPPVVKNRGVATPHLAHSGWPHIRSIYNYLHLLLNKYRNACIYIYVYTYIYIYIYAYVYIYVHTYMYIYICIHMYIYIYIHIHAFV